MEEEELIIKGRPGISVAEAGDIATKSSVSILVGSVALFYFIYWALIKK